METGRPSDRILAECYTLAKGDLTAFLKELNKRSWKPESPWQINDWFNAARETQTWSWGPSPYHPGPDDAA